MNSPQNVRFSVLMPVFNSEKFVGAAIDSILSQTFTDFEVIVIDDGSTDHSLEVIWRYGPRITVLRQSNQGPEVARNKGAAVARGEYLVFLDSDDVFYPFALETLDLVIREFASPPLVLATLQFFDTDGEIPSQPADRVEVFKYRNFLSRTRPLGSANRAANLTDSIVVKRTVFNEVGGMRNSDSRTFHNEDSNLLLKLGEYSPCVVVNEPCITAYRKHDAKSTRNLQAIGNGWLRMGRAERRGEYGRKNKWPRYALIGGRSLQWAQKYCWPGGERKLALRLLTENLPMVVVAVIDKALRKIRKTDPSIILSAEHLQASEKPLSMAAHPY
jgi:glycosyltransferase involved in cell wall biosynthesis